MGGGRGHIAQVKKLVPFRSFMLLAAVLFLSWIGAWVSQNPGSEVQLHCKCTGTTETVICPPVWILVGGIDQSLESFVFLEIDSSHFCHLTTKTPEEPEFLERTPQTPSQIGLPRFAVGEPDQRALAQQQLDLLRRCRGQ